MYREDVENRNRRYIEDIENLEPLCLHKAKGRLAELHWAFHVLAPFGLSANDILVKPPPSQAELMGFQRL